MPVTISQYVLKVHNRCDLACDHCYVYEHADQSWRSKPRSLSITMADAAAIRIAEHAARHRLPNVRVVLHGGEPLLLGYVGMSEVLALLDRRITPVTHLNLRIHTNGVGLNERWCELFGRYGVKIGVSLDGDKMANDRHRRFANGRSSHAQVMCALALLRQPEHQHLYAGILCTIDITNDPIAVYEALLAQDPPRLDLLLPHATWEHPPAKPAGLAEPYADWLLRIYRRWTADCRPIPIRLFDSLLSAVNGGPSWSEAVGLDPVGLVVIETDGSYEEPDSLKVAYDGAPATGLNVFSHTVDEVAQLPGFVARAGGIAALSETCRACSVVRTCGGGLYAHRYRAANGYDNPSVYCADLKALITQLAQVVRRSPSTATPRSKHVLPDGAFDALAAGPGSVEAISSIAQVQLSLTRALVAAVAAEAGRSRNGDLRLAALEGWELLCALDAEHPVAVQEVFAHPHIRAWAVRCLTPPAESDPELDRAHLAGFAAAAALHAGVTATLLVPVRDGVLHFPTLGALRLTENSERTAQVCVSRGQLAVAGRDGMWESRHSVLRGLVRVALEDLDPFRGFGGIPVTGRLSLAQRRSWQQGLKAAGSRLCADVPAYASVLGVGLRGVVPLRPSGGIDRAATARHTFGSVALAFPHDPTNLDALLLHEFQHVKLHALIDIYELFDPADPRRLTVPWRKDPRPIEGVIHGAYAHLALVHLWLSRGPSGREAYLRNRSWVRDATGALASIGVLTAEGERFVNGMQAAVHSDA